MPRLPAEEEPAGVSEHEWEVAGFVAQGLTNREIAEALCLSVSTVKSHLANLSPKLDVSNRTQITLRVGEHRRRG